MSVEPAYAILLRRLALHDASTVDSVVGGSMLGPELALLSDRTIALLRVAALVATDASESSYQWLVAMALAAGNTEDEIVGVLVKIGPIVGAARLASAASPLAAALGLDLDVLSDPDAR